MATPANPRAATHNDILGPRTSPPRTGGYSVGHGYHTVAPRHNGVHNLAAKRLREGSHHQRRPHPTMDVQGAVPREQIPDGAMGRHTPTLHRGHTRNRTTNEQTSTYNKPKPRGARPMTTMVVLHHPVDHTGTAGTTKQRPHTTAHRNPI